MSLGSASAMVATSQPLAAQAAVETLKKGGNAVDAALTASFMLDVVEPMSTGAAGDLFALYYEAKTGKLHCLNASGFAPAKATLDEMRSRGLSAMPADGILSTAVPGTLKGRQALIEKFGALKLADVIQPAIQAAESGFRVTKQVAKNWKNAEPKLMKHDMASMTYLPAGRAPVEGELFRNEFIASTYKKIARDGIGAFYEGEIAREIAKESERLGGLITLDDLRSYEPYFTEPISTDYRGYRVYEAPPNGQGLIVLLALNILETLEIDRFRRDRAERLHLQIEAIKLAFMRAKELIADPHFADVPVKMLISKDFASGCARLITGKAMPDSGSSINDGGTVCITVVDKEGNAISLLESLFLGFGSGVIAGKTGLTLLSRSALFSLDPSHPNRIEPRKRPYNTILPSMVFKAGRPAPPFQPESRLAERAGPWITFGYVGGFMQPQGQLQVLSNIIDFGIGLQEAIDAPKFQYMVNTKSRKVALEGGFDIAVIDGLRSMGHDVTNEIAYFGGAQGILIGEDGVLTGGSDHRKDGLALGL